MKNEGFPGAPSPLGQPDPERSALLNARLDALALRRSASTGPTPQPRARTAWHKRVLLELNFMGRVAGYLIAFVLGAFCWSVWSGVRPKHLAAACTVHLSYLTGSEKTPWTDRAKQVYEVTTDQGVYLFEADTGNSIGIPHSISELWTDPHFEVLDADTQRMAVEYTCGRPARIKELWADSYFKELSSNDRRTVIEKVCRTPKPIPKPEPNLDGFVPDPIQKVRPLQP